MQDDEKLEMHKNMKRDEMESRLVGSEEEKGGVSCRMMFEYGEAAIFLTYRNYMDLYILKYWDNLYFSFLCI